MKLNFANAGWKTDDIVYASSYRFTETPEFFQCDGWVENGQNPTQSYGCDNVAFLTRKQFGSGTTVTTECAFFDISAPLLIIADEMHNEDGVWKYGVYLEIVLWKNGVNVWRMVMDENKKVTWKLMLGIEHPFAEEVPHTLSATVKDDVLEISADELKAKLRMNDLYKSFHLGINACEGTCRFYNFNIEE